MTAKRVLMIDDEPDVLKILGKSLQSKGFTVIQADSGPEGISLALTQHPDVIILDVMMPGMSGGEVAGRLRESPLTKDIPIIFLTALLSKEEEEAMDRCIGNNLTLAKPFDVDELIRLIENVELV